MSAGQDWTDADFVSPARVAVNDARGRFEFLLRVIRFLLTRGVSFSSIEETMVAAGLPSGPAERIVELVIQEVQGHVHPPGAYPEVDVSPAVLAALGFKVQGLPVAAGSLLEAAAFDPVPALAFTQPTDATEATLARARGANRTFVIVAVFFAALCAAFVLLFLFAM